mmetsp:Transcript_35433/g.101856  ORF Transcript_35433/g.101856 Transcript_35433/m.101856 type:complete len:255 (+) Transcript_35433:47-811(+)
MTSAPSSSKLRLMLVRHGQSMNNVVQERIGPMLQRGDITAEEFTRLWMSERVDDPDLSSKGKAEAEKLGQYYAAWLRKEGVGAKLYASAMVRACQTIQPLSEALGIGAQVRPDIFEVGGIYSSDSEGRPAPGKTNTAAELQALFPTYDVQAVAEVANGGMWYTQGHESRQEAIQRANTVSAWLKSPALAAEVNGDVAFMVMHADFLNLLCKELLGTKTDFLFANTSTALMEIDTITGHITVIHMVRVDHLISSL